jgi:hypothetical protein
LNRHPELRGARRRRAGFHGALVSLRRGHLRVRARTP